MSSVAIVFWSGTGNTEAMADFIAEGVEAKGGTATIIQAADFGAERVPEFDAFAFGCPAMGDEELEDTEFLPMYDEVEPLMEGEKGRPVRVVRLEQRRMDGVLDPARRRSRHPARGNRYCQRLPRRRSCRGLPPPG